MVRVGGGFVTIGEYYDKYSSKQCVALFTSMKNGSINFLQQTVKLLQANQASQEIIEAYKAEEENMNNSNLNY